MKRWKSIIKAKFKRLLIINLFCAATIFLSLVHHHALQYTIISMFLCVLCNLIVINCSPMMSSIIYSVINVILLFAFLNGVPELIVNYLSTTYDSYASDPSGYILLHCSYIGLFVSFVSFIKMNEITVPLSILSFMFHVLYTLYVSLMIFIVSII